MAWPKKNAVRDPMTWLIEELSDNPTVVQAHLSQLVAQGWFVHSIAPREFADGRSRIFIVSCRRDKTAAKKKAKAKDADSE